MSQYQKKMLLLSALLVAPVLAACADEQPLAPAATRTASAPRLAISTAGAAPYAYRCTNSMAPDQALANDTLRDAYVAWLDQRVTAVGTKGPGQLRVNAGPRKHHGTVSEGQGYGMLLAAYMGDRKTFNELWAYSKALHNTNKLMAWYVDSVGVVVDSTAATDADEDMAFALLVAHQKWNAYWPDFSALVGALKQHAVEPGTNVFKPGDTWGGSNALYVSYLAPAYYRAFSTYTGDASWDGVTTKSYDIIAAINARGENAGTGLLPDYARADGAPVVGAGASAYWFSWDAIRAPWRLAKDAVWNCDATAKAQLDRINAFFADPSRRAGNIKSGYELDGDVKEPWHSVAFVGPLTAAALVSTDAGYKADMWAHLVASTDASYYANELRQLGLLMASGNMEDPLGWKRRRRIDDFESATVTRWWPFADAAGSSLTRQVIRPAAVGYGMQVNYNVVHWAGLGTDVAQDWSGFRALEFWVRGGGSGNQVGIEIEDADGELFRHVFVDDFTDWRFASIPLDTAGFPRRTSGQPVATNNGLTLSNVKTLRFTPFSGQGSFWLDRMELIPK